MAAQEKSWWYKSGNSDESFCLICWWRFGRKREAGRRAKVKTTHLVFPLSLCCHFPGAPTNCLFDCLSVCLSVCLSGQSSYALSSAQHNLIILLRIHAKNDEQFKILPEKSEQISSPCRYLRFMRPRRTTWHTKYTAPRMITSFPKSVNTTLNEEECWWWWWCCWWSLATPLVPSLTL